MDPNEMLKLAEKCYEGMSEEDIVEMGKIMLDRSNFLDQNRVFKLLEGVTDKTLVEAVELITNSRKEVL